MRSRERICVALVAAARADDGVLGIRGTLLGHQPYVWCLNQCSRVRLLWSLLCRCWTWTMVDDAYDW